MAQINRSDAAAPNLGPGQLEISQGNFREQQDAMGDSLRQLGGFAEVEPGNGTVNDPLNAPFILYVNPYTGSDTFVGGGWATADAGATPEENRRQELRRIELQRLECGYTEARPFLTINRAIIEAGLITSKDYFNNVDQDDQQVCIILQPGVHTLDNAAGTAVNGVVAFANNNSRTLTAAELRAFNPQAGVANNPPLGGGVILPRGCSMVSMDLRKTIIRPTFVPATADEQAQNAAGFFPNRAAMFRTSGNGYYYGFTLMDAEGVNRSHHLLSGFEYTTTNQLTEFYNKLNQAFGTNSVYNYQNDGAWDSEGEIVAPKPDRGQNIDTDNTESSSPYIYNCSIRSVWGLCGLLANGTGVDGFRSCVMAPYPSVSLQRDLSCWEAYNERTDTWGAVADYDTLINDIVPDNLRPDVNRRSFHIRATNDAVIQEVSVFAIGQAVHHWVQSGSEITITNSNSNFGGAAALAQGYQENAFPVDTGHGVDELKRATDLFEKTNNIRRIYLGTIAAGVANNATNIDLTQAIGTADDDDNEPNLIGPDYTLRPGSQIWVENSTGADYRAALANTAWDNADPDRVVVTAAFQDEAGNAPGSNIITPGVVLQAGVGAITSNSNDFVNGVYQNIPLIPPAGNNGTGCQATITVTGTNVTGVTITQAGSGYGTAQINFTANNANIGGGTTFSVAITPQDIDTGVDRGPLAGARLYIRRLQDTRTVDERRYSLILENANAARRVPVRDYVLQPPNGQNDYNQNADGVTPRPVAVLDSSPDDNSIRGSEVEIKRINPNNNFQANIQYRPGDPLNEDNKHWICTEAHFSGAAVDLTNFQENYVHMPEAYAAEDY